MAELTWDASFDSVASFALSGALFVGLVVIVVAIAVGASLRISKQVDIAVTQAELVVQKHGGTAVPAFAALVSSAGLAICGWQLSPGLVVLVGLLSAAFTFAFACLGDTESKARFIGTIGALLPFIALASVAVATGAFDGSLETKLSVGAFCVVALLGVGCLLAKSSWTSKGTQGDLAPARQSL
jgi:hypothetical protein